MSHSHCDSVFSVWEFPIPLFFDDLMESCITCIKHDAPILYEPYPNNDSFRRSILYQGAIVWNALPVEERAIDTHTKFKNVQLLNNI